MNHRTYIVTSAVRTVDRKSVLAVVERVLMSSPTSPMPSSIHDAILQFALPQISTALISFTASTMMAIMVALVEPALSVPYRRIMFGLSIADMIQSLGFLVGPISLPRGIPGSWGLGNEATCAMAGFLSFAGTLAVWMYTCFVCWYYVCKLKYHMSNDAFAHKSEKKIHVVIILVVLLLSLAAVGMNTFHPVPIVRTFCYVAPDPLDCMVSEVECDATIMTRAHVFFTIQLSIQLPCTFGMIIMMVMIHVHVIRRNRILRPHLPYNSEYISDEETLNEIQGEVLHLSSVYRKEILCQATCYFGAYCLTYVPRYIVYFIAKAGRTPPEPIAILTLTLLPFGGFFNILVHTRPQVSVLHRAYPERSLLYCFWLVLRAGGEIPHSSSDDDGNGRQQQRHRDAHYSVSSNEPFGEEDDGMNQSLDSCLSLRMVGSPLSESDPNPSTESGEPCLEMGDYSSNIYSSTILSDEPKGDLSLFPIKMAK